MPPVEGTPLFFTLLQTDRSTGEILNSPHNVLVNRIQHIVQNLMADMAIQRAQLMETARLIKDGVQSQEIISRIESVCCQQERDMRRASTFLRFVADAILQTDPDTGPYDFFGQFPLFIERPSEARESAQDRAQILFFVVQYELAIRKDIDLLPWREMSAKDKRLIAEFMNIISNETVTSAEEISSFRHENLDSLVDAFAILLKEHYGQGDDEAVLTKIVENNPLLARLIRSLQEIVRTTTIEQRAIPLFDQAPLHLPTADQFLANLRVTLTQFFPPNLLKNPSTFSCRVRGCQIGCLTACQIVSHCFNAHDNRVLQLRAATFRPDSNNYLFHAIGMTKVFCVHCFKEFEYLHWNMQHMHFDWNPATTDMITIPLPPLEFFPGHRQIHVWETFDSLAAEQGFTLAHILEVNLHVAQEFSSDVPADMPALGEKVRELGLRVFLPVLRPVPGS